MHRAKPVCRVAFPDLTPPGIENVANAAQDQGATIKICMLNGQCTHETEDHFRTEVLVRTVKEKINKDPKCCLIPEEKMCTESRK